ncbi:5655_t:CDS:2, partial [Dentiscutata heterogama]
GDLLNNPYPFYLLISINITDPSYNPFADNGSMYMYAYDAGMYSRKKFVKSLNILDSYNNITINKYIEYNPFREDFKNSPPLYDKFLKSIYNLNVYYYSPPTRQSSYIFHFSRKIRKMLIQTPLTYIGFAPDYYVQPFIESYIQTIQYSGLQYNVALEVQIQPWSTIVEEQKEQKSDTVITLLGITAALYSAIASFYVFLFEELKRFSAEKRVKHLEKLTMLFEDYI